MGSCSITAANLGEGGIVDVTGDNFTTAQGQSSQPADKDGLQVLYTGW